MKINKQLLKDSSIGQKIIVDFYAEWCKPCQRIKPIIKHYEILNPEIKFIYIDIDNYEKDFLKKEFGVISVPNISFYYNERKKDFLLGSDEKSLEQKIEKFKKL